MSRRVFLQGEFNSAVVKNTIFPVFCMGNKILFSDFYDDKLRRIQRILNRMDIRVFFKHYTIVVQ